MGRPETLAQWMSPAVKRPASKKQGISSTPSNPAPVTRRRAASMACDLGDDVAAQRGITAADDFHWARRGVWPRANRLADIPVFSSTAVSSGRLRVLVRMKQVDPGSARPAAYSSASKTVTTRDVVHGLRAGGVVVEHGDTAAGGGVSGPDPLARPRFVPHGRGGGEDFLGGRAVGVGARSRSSELLGLGNEGHEICRPPLTS